MAITKGKFDLKQIDIGVVEAVKDDQASIGSQIQADKSDR